MAAHPIGGAKEVPCPGCGVRLPAADAPPPDRFNASGACWARYNELAAYTLSLGDAAFSHQFAVDAYAAQHAGGPSKPIATTFALVGLYLACERGLSGRAVQRAHMALARHKRTWPDFPVPARAGPLTVLDVLAAPPGRPRDAALRDWAASIWATWSDEHARIRALLAEWLPGDPRRFEGANGRSR